MLGPGWEEGCPSCSYMADHTDGMLPHLAARDVTMIAVSRAPLAEIEAFKKRMGWQFPWASSHGSDFNRDFHVSFTEKEVESGKVYYNYTKQSFGCPEAPGISVFHQAADGSVYHTYSVFGRGVELMMGTYRILDLTPKGRDEDHFERSMEWVRYHDSYEAGAAKGASELNEVDSMNLSCCSHRWQPRIAPEAPRQRKSWLRRVRGIAGWILPSALLALMPKCPICLAAYVALFTGFTMSGASAHILMRTLTVLCLGTLALCVVRTVVSCQQYKRTINLQPTTTQP